MTQDKDTQSSEVATTENLGPEEVEMGAVTDESTTGDATHPEENKNRRLALLVVLFLCLSVAIVWAGYLGWQELQSVKTALADVESDAQADALKLAQEQDAKRNASLRVFANDLAATDARVDSLDESVQMLTAQLVQSNASKPAALVIAEIEYLLRLANHRVALESDRDGALFALAIAQSRLSQLQADGFAPLQLQLSNDMAALQAARGADTSRVLGALTKLIGDVESLDAGKKRQAPSGDGESVGGAGVKGILSSMSANLGQFFEVRKAEGNAVPALIPDQERLARQNIRLSLANARAAALRTDLQTYHLSLQEAERWLQDYFPADSKQARAMLVSVEELRNATLKPSLPGLEASLALLRSIAHTDIYLQSTTSPGVSASPEAANTDPNADEQADSQEVSTQETDTGQENVSASEQLETEVPAQASSDSEAGNETVDAASDGTQNMSAVTQPSDEDAPVTEQVMEVLEENNDQEISSGDGAAVTEQLTEVLEENNDQGIPASETMQEANQ